jgi:antitoxin (DNA-binding transcriptional repressor) of toxin-antitoxin stability system
MEHRITATELARSLGDVLARVRFRQDVFLVERNGEVVARVVPAPGSSATTLAEFVKAWQEAGPADPGFADDLELVGSMDEPPDDPWAS